MFNSYYNDVRHITPYFNFNLFTIVEYCLLSYFIYRLIKNKVFRMMMLVCSLAFLGIAIIHISGTFHNEYDSVTNVLASILLIIYSIFYLFEQIRKPDHIFFYAVSEFWVIVGILLYFSGTFFIFLYAQSQIENDSFKLQYSVINNAFDILKSLLFGVAMLMRSGDKNNNLSRIDFDNLDEHLNLNR